jgi:hypothetical protein
MKKILVAIACVTVLGGSFAFYNSQKIGATEPITEEQARGCCSYHNGVCGCNSMTGYLRCCDGTDSPSCRCGW